MKNANDETVKALKALVDKKKREIQKAERPSWQTNCIFPLGIARGQDSTINIQTVTSIDVLVELTSKLIGFSRHHEEALKILDVKGKFTWNNHSYEDWISDFKTRANKINITSKKKELEKLEEKLDSLMSPEMRAEIELEKIKKELEEE